MGTTSSVKDIIEGVVGDVAYHDNNAVYATTWNAMWAMMADTENATLRTTFRVSGHAITTVGFANDNTLQS